MIHGLDRSLDFQPYGKVGEAINSISRSGLNIELLNAAERAGATIHFNCKCESVDLAGHSAIFSRNGEELRVDVDILIGTDGANSALRHSMETSMDGFHSDVEWLSHDYRELEIPAGEGGAFRMEKHALHIWPRHEFMMIALPNPDGSFTCTLFAPSHGPDGFEPIKSDEDVINYFERFFPDALPMMPTLVADWHRNPQSKLATVYCDPWHYEDWALLLGDSAHAIVPFYGQGMNACFEDCVVLGELLDAHDNDWRSVIPAFYMSRKPNADAIAELALQNFVEMRSRVVDPRFIQKKRIDNALNEMFPDRWLPLYGMVTFSTIPYREALDRARKQDERLERIGYDRVEEALAKGKGEVEKVVFETD
jgi:kynurenine 3-monooxygenase